MHVELEWARAALASAGVAGLIGDAHEGDACDGDAHEDNARDGAAHRDNAAAAYVMYVPLLSCADPDVESGYALVCCAWIKWLRVAHCVLRAEPTHVVACFRFETLDQAEFVALLQSIKQVERCLA